MNRDASRKPRSSFAKSAADSPAPTRRTRPERRGAADALTRRGDPVAGAPAPTERRRASRFLWAACESLLAATAEPRSLNRALDMLKQAFECDGVALHALAPSGRIEPWSARGAWQTTAGDLRDCMSVPLSRGDERVGTLELLAAPGKSWRPAQLGLIRTAAGALGAALGARIELQRLRNVPGRDALTGLPDVRAFHTRLGEELTRAQRHAVPVSVIVLDVDRVAQINARYGRPAGDAVLAEIALVLKLVLRESDVVARFEGDAFGIVLPETDRDSALRCAARVRHAIEEHRFPRAGRISASAGVAACPNDGSASVEILDAAERAVALAKKGGRRRVMVASPAAVH